MRIVLALLAGASLSLSVLPAAAEDLSSPQAPDAWSTTGEALPVGDGVIVHWDSGVSKAARAQARDEVNTDDFQNLGNAKFQLLTLSEGQDPDQAVRELRGNPDVASVSRDGYSVLHAAPPNDPLFGKLWGLDNQGLNVGGVGSSTAGDDIDALKAWDKTVGDDSIVIADLDDGIRPQHPDLQNRIWSNSDELAANGVDDDNNGFIDDTFGMDFAGPNIDSIVVDNDPTDDIPDGGHGTHTAGTIAAQGNNGVGITGVAQKATIMPLRVCGWSPSLGGVYCLFSSQIAGINYAGANGARVANMSLGGTSASQPVRDAFAANPQVLFVISAGNNNKDTEVAGQTTYPCAWDPSASGVPGAVDNVVCVAASDQNDAKASFSNWGKNNVDIAAPGTETLSTYPSKEVYGEDFEDAGFDFTGWTNSGWQRVSGAPLTSSGITNDTATQTAGTTRTLATPTAAVQGPGWCRVSFFRKLTSTGNDDQATNDKFVYSSVLDGSPVTVTTGLTQSPISTSVGFDVPSGSHTVGLNFSYRKGTATPASNGVWIDDVRFKCFAPPGQETATSYEFLQGTSMAAPHVTGAAALLAAFEPGATTRQLRQALLSSVDPAPAFNPAGPTPIATGGRLNADQALTAIDTLIPPDTTITSAPPASSPQASASFAFTSPAKTPVTFECQVDGGGFSACVSPFTVTGLGVGDHTFDVRAKDQPGNVDPRPANAAWTVTAPPPPPPPPPPPVSPPPPPPPVSPPPVSPPPVSPPPVSPPGKVTGVKVKRQKTSAVLKWRAVPGATGYTVKIGTSTKRVTAPGYTLKKLKPGKKFTVTLAAVNAAGPGPSVVVTIKKFR